MAMTLQQGSVLSNGSAGASGRVPLTPELSSTGVKDEVTHHTNASNGGSENGVHSVPREDQEEITAAVEEPSIDIIINNVVCSFSVRSHLDLKQIAQTGYNVEYRRENGV